MKRFLKGKSSKGSEDADRNALFGNRAAPQRRPSSESTASRETQLPPYQDPYASTAAAGQRQDPGLRRNEKSESRAPPSAGSSYANDPYARPSAGLAGRGGLQRDPPQSSSTSAQRDELFRGARPDRRLEPAAYSAPPPAMDDDAYGSNAQEGGQQSQEQEDEEVEGIKQEMRFVKQESLSSTRNALRLANEAEAAGRSTLEKLGEQSETLANAEHALDLSALGNREAQEKARTLKHLNRSMFAVQVNKPWGKNKRLEADELRVRQQFEDDRYERDLRTQNRKESDRRTDANLKAHANALSQPVSRQKMSLAERSKYQYEADEEDDEVEGEIDGNLDQLAAVTARLKGLAQATNDEVTKQNAQLQRLDAKGEAVEIGLHMNTHRLKRIGERG